MKLTNSVLAYNKKEGFTIKEEGGNLYAYAWNERIGNFIVGKKFLWHKLKRVGVITCGDIHVKDEEHSKSVGTALLVLGLRLCSKRFKEVIIRVDDLMLRNFLREFGALDAWGFFERFYPFAREPTNLKFVLDKKQLEFLEKKREELKENWEIKV